jgi:pimeloyl-ACP methyl ester carboxylesterase
MPTGTSSRSLISRIGRLLRGCFSILGVVLFPVGRFTGGFLRHLHTPDRLNCGLVLVLPGIEGESCINHGIVRGLADGGVQAAIEIFDWTTSLFLLFPYHLRGWRRNVVQAERLAQRIVEYRRTWPGRPVYLVGHSGGAALTVLTLARLSSGVTVTGAVLLQAAISPRYNLAAALARTELGIWSFHSVFDLFFLGLFTCILGTVDGRHAPAAGMIGFRRPSCLAADEQRLYAARLHQTAFHARMCGAFHFGGHMGSVNRVFVSETIAPLLAETTNKRHYSAP